MSLEDFGRELVGRRKMLEKLAVSRNAGTRRSASKRALLKAIEDAGGTW